MSDDDERPYDDDTPLPVKPRPKAKNLPLRPSVPSVERSLDRFIEEAKATPHAHDVSYFDAGTREDQLANEITELRKQLAATEQRAADAAATVRAPTPIEPAPARMRWGAVVAAFAIGGACMFAVTRLTRESSGGASAAAPVPSAPVHAAVDPEQKPEPVKQAAPEPAPAIPTAPDQPAPAVALKPKPAIKNPIKRTVKPVDPPPPSPPAKPSSDDGLYNPFGPAK